MSALQANRRSYPSGTSVPIKICRVGKGTAAGLALLLASGCAAHYAYTPPDTLEGQACVAGCESVLKLCNAQQEQRDLETSAKCAAEAQERQMQCARPTECPPVPCRHVSDSGFCGENHRKCYRECGGSVVER